MKILIADDEEIVRTTLETIFKKLGNYELDFAIDGDEAVSKVQNLRYDLIILDVAMPKKDGYEVLRQVRAKHIGIPVIFLTGRSDSRQVAQSIAQYKLNGFIEKPFSPEQVLEVVNKALKKL